MLENRAEIRARIRDWAQRNERDYERVERDFVDAVVEKEGSKNILNFARRTEERQVDNIALINMAHRGRALFFIYLIVSQGLYYFLFIENSELFTI